MQALRILPALMSVLAMAISLLASDCIGGIIAADLAMLADVHAIMAADAGENARTESAAEIIKAVFIWTSLQSINQTGVMPAWQLRLVAADGFAGGRLQAGGRGTEFRASAWRECCRSRSRPCRRRVPGRTPDTCRRDP